jgi:hypothetical protein
MKYIDLLICLLICAVSNAGTIDPSVPDAKYVEYGSKYECVLPIMGSFNDEHNSIFKGSCVVIDEYYVLTAAHILYESKNQYVIFNNKKYQCLVVAIHSDFKHNKTGLYDIAMVRMAEPIKLNFYPELYTDSDEKGKICGMAGYGFTGNFRTGFRYENFDHKKRGGSNIIEDIQDHVLVFSVHKTPSTKLEFLIAPGDSGGGLFIDKKLAGIHSYIYAVDGKTDADYGDTGCSTRISQYVDWINKTKIILETVIEAINVKKRM